VAQRFSGAYHRKPKEDESQDERMNPRIEGVPCNFGTQQLCGCLETSVECGSSVWVVWCGVKEAGVGFGVDNLLQRRGLPLNGAAGREGGTS
jgi:hypothetical protein